MDEASPSIGNHPCQATRKDGQPCTVPVVAGEPYCFAHSERTAAQRAQARQRGGANSARAVRVQRLVPSTLRPVLATLLEVLGEVRRGDLAPGQANAVANVAGAIVKVYTSATVEDRLSELETQIAALSRRPA